MSKKEFKLSEYKLTHINVEVEMQDELKRKQRRFDYSLNLNIKAAYDMRLDMAGIDLIDLCIFEVIKSMMISDSFSKVIVEGVQWIWVAHSKVLDQCPFLEIKKQRLSQRIQKLCDVGLLKKHLDMASGSRTLYRQGPSFDGMLLAGGTEKITHPSVVSYAGGTEKITDNNIILNKSINNECKSDLGKSSPTTSSEESKIEEGEKPKKDISRAAPSCRLYEWFYERLKAQGALPTSKGGRIALHQHGKSSATDIEAQVGYEMAVKVYEWGFEHWFRVPDLSNWSSLKTEYDKKAVKPDKPYNPVAHFQKSHGVVA